MFLQEDLCRKSLLTTGFLASSLETTVASFCVNASIALLKLIQVAPSVSDPGHFFGHLAIEMPRPPAQLFLSHPRCRAFLAVSVSVASITSVGSVAACLAGKKRG